MLQKPSLRLF